MSKRKKKLLLKILGLAVILGPIFLNRLGIVNHLSKSTIFLLFLTGAILLISGDYMAKGYNQKNDQFNWKRGMQKLAKFMGLEKLD